MGIVGLDIREHVREVIPETDDLVLGFADLTRLLPESLGRYKSGIVIGKKLDDEIIDSIESGPNTQYFHLYRQVNNHLSALAHRVHKKLILLGVSSTVIEPTIGHFESIKILTHLRYYFSHKMAATRAGLGWIGKTDLLVTESFGPRLRLVTVLFDHELDHTPSPIDESKCGDCDICVRRCPAKAANGKLWNIYTDRNEFYNSRKCMKKCIELSMKHMMRFESICGICISVCPVGKS